jgi:Ca2+/H+ antiporter
MTSGQSSSVQSTLAGSILANLLFVLGLSITLGSLRRPEQFNAFAARV